MLPFFNFFFFFNLYIYFSFFFMSSFTLAAEICLECMSVRGVVHVGGNLIKAHIPVCQTGVGGIEGGGRLLTYNIYQFCHLLPCANVCRVGFHNTDSGMQTGCVCVCVCASYLPPTCFPFSPAFPCLCVCYLILKYARNSTFPLFLHV